MRWEVEYWLDHEPVAGSGRRFSVQFDDQSDAMRFAAWVVECGGATFAIFRRLLST